MAVLGGGAHSGAFRMVGAGAACGLAAGVLDEPDYVLVFAHDYGPVRFYARLARADGGAE